MTIHDLTITSALKLLRAKELTSVELVSMCLEQIEKYNATYNVFLTIAAKDNLMKQAKDADSTDHALPLSGIPIALKDIFSTKGMRTTAASKVLENYIPEYDATVVRKLKEAGAIIMGKVNQDAWAHGSTGENSQFGPTGNAYNAEFVAGGSSSGSAVSVRLGMCLAATATDTGGSIRNPAAWNNLVGLKPTYGRVSRYGIIAMASSLDSIGHITKSVEDSAYLLAITAGKDPFDATSAAENVANYVSLLNRNDLKGLKVGVAPEYLAIGKKATDGMNREVETLTEEALTKLVSLGAEIVSVSLPHTEAALEAYYILCPSEVSSNLGRYDGIRYGNNRSSFGDEAKRRIMIGTYTLSAGYYDAYYKTAQRVRTLICEEFAEAFKKCDVIFAPVAPTPPVKIGEKVGDPLALYLMDIYAVPVNLAGIPSLALPAGFIDGLPVGIQLLGKHFNEETLFSVGKVYEQATNFREQLPKL